MWDAALLINFKTMQLVRAPSRAFFFLEKRMPNWRTEYRRCDNCRSEYRPQREAQSYCSRDCRRAAAYGRERFNAGTVGRRRRRLEASDKLPASLIAGSFRNGVFSQLKQDPTDRQLGSRNSIRQPPTKSTARTGLVSNVIGLSISWAAIDSQASDTRSTSSQAYVRRS
jgi:hypothetical protein